MKTALKRFRRGFTLIELSIAMLIGMATGTMVLALFNQQIAFLKVYRAQNFLTDEAPIISMYVSRLIGKADRFRLHDSVADALAGTNPRLTESPVVVLNFREPNGSMRAAILSYENRALNYYVVPVSGVLGTPQWAVTKAPSKVAFSMSEGVLRMTLTGPKKERITYSGTMQQ
jgi:Prokaryotic N-terminal methylation motif